MKQAQLRSSLVLSNVCTRCWDYQIITTYRQCNVKLIIWGFFFFFLTILSTSLILVFPSLVLRRETSLWDSKARLLIRNHAQPSLGVSLAWSLWNITLSLTTSCFTFFVAAVSLGGPLEQGVSLSLTAGLDRLNWMRKLSHFLNVFLYLHSKSQKALKCDSGQKLLCLSLLNCSWKTVFNFKNDCKAVWY